MTKVDWEYDEKCETSYEEHCSGYGYEKKCEQVPKEMCHQVPVKVEKQVKMILNDEQNERSLHQTLGLTITKNHRPREIGQALLFGALEKMARKKQKILGVFEKCPSFSAAIV